MTSKDDKPAEKAEKRDPELAKAEKDLAKAQESGVGVRDARAVLGDYHAHAVQAQEAAAREKADKTVFTGESTAE